MDKLKNPKIPPKIPKSPNNIFHREKTMVEKKWKTGKMKNPQKMKKKKKWKNEKTEKPLNSKISHQYIS